MIYFLGESHGFDDFFTYFRQLYSKNHFVALRKYSIVLVFCMLGVSTQTVKFSGEETVASEVKELAVVYHCIKMGLLLHLCIP